MLFFLWAINGCRFHLIIILVQHEEDNDPNANNDKRIKPDPCFKP
jgi:hypothetical protein